MKRAHLSFCSLYFFFGLKRQSTLQPGLLTRRGDPKLSGPSIDFSLPSTVWPSIGLSGCEGGKSSLTLTYFSSFWSFFKAFSKSSHQALEAAKKHWAWSVCKINVHGSLSDSRMPSATQRKGKASSTLATFCLCSQSLELAFHLYSRLLFLFVGFVGHLLLCIINLDL